MITLRIRFRNCLEYKIIQIARNVKYVYTDPENCSVLLATVPDTVWNNLKYFNSQSNSKMGKLCYKSLIYKRTRYGSTRTSIAFFPN